MLLEDRELREQAAQIEALLAEIESFPDPSMRERAAEIVQSLLVLYGEGLARILAIVDDTDEGERSRILQAFAADELISHLLLLHDLHPVDVETRVRQALAEVRPYLESHGGNVELLGVENGVARLRLQGSCSGCPSSTVTLKLAIEEAIQKAAPDLERIEAEGVAEPPPRPAGFVSVADLLGTKPAESGPKWTAVEAASDIPTGGMRAIEVTGQAILFLTIDGTLYAYRNICPECGSSLDGATLQGAELVCPGCEQQYDIRRAGRSLTMPERQLEPVPLLQQNGLVKVAMGRTAGPTGTAPATSCND